MLRNSREVSGCPPFVYRLSPWGLTWSQSPIDRARRDNHNAQTTSSHQETGSLGTCSYGREPISTFCHGGGPGRCKAGSAQDWQVCQTDPEPVEGAWPVCNKYLLMVQSKPGECPGENEVAGVVSCSSWSSVSLPDTELLPLAELLQLVRLTFPS